MHMPGVFCHSVRICEIFSSILQVREERKSEMDK